jgi:hypothetical protein
MAGHAHRGTGGAPSSLGLCYAMTPKVAPGLGIAVRTRCAVGRAGQCSASSSAPIYAARRRS